MKSNVYFFVYVMLVYNCCRVFFVYILNCYKFFVGSLYICYFNLNFRDVSVSIFYLCLFVLVIVYSLLLIYV